MKAVLTIIKKEFMRFFGDRRLLLTTLLLPGVVLYAVYSALGAVFANVMQDSSVPVAYVRNMPESLGEAIDEMFDLRDTDLTDEEVKSQLVEGDADIFIIFPENFDDLTVGSDVPDVSIYYNSAQTSSSLAYSSVVALLDAYEQSIANVFNINSGSDRYDLADSSDVSANILSMIVPMVLIMLLLSGCVAVVLESIAGEKERGTIATLLVTPIKRSYFAIGKILSLSVIAVLSGISSFLGLILSLPNLMGGMEVDFSLAAYGVLDYFGLFLVVMSTVLVLVSLLAIVSAYAKSVKEASGLIAPVMIIAVICSLVSMFVASPPMGLYFIPVLNSALCISTLMAGTFGIVPFLITMGINIVCAALLAVLLGAMFNSEKIMFNRA